MACGTMNDNGKRLVEFCLENNCAIGGTIFPHKDIHKLTWNSPDGKTSNQIDHIVINGKWRRSVQDTRVYRGADVFSDHHLLVVTIKLKLRKTKTEGSTRKHIDISKLKCPKINPQFVLDLKNHFSALADTSDVDTKWNTINDTYVETATIILGYRKSRNKEYG